MDDLDVITFLCNILIPVSLAVFASFFIERLIKYSRVSRRIGGQISKDFEDQSIHALSPGARRRRARAELDLALTRRLWVFSVLALLALACLLLKFFHGLWVVGYLAEVMGEFEPAAFLGGIREVAVVFIVHSVILCLNLFAITLFWHWRYRLLTRLELKTLEEPTQGSGG